jgi:hypothetical protein
MAFFPPHTPELNTKEDELSKEALLLPVGVFGYYEFLEGEEIEAMEFMSLRIPLDKDREGKFFPEMYEGSEFCFLK